MEELSANLIPGGFNGKWTSETGHILTSFFRRALRRCLHGQMNGFRLEDSPKKADKTTLVAEWYRVFLKDVQLDASDLRLAGMSEDEAIEGLETLERLLMGSARKMLGAYRLCGGLI
jgi:hypothetical protein